MLFKIDSVSIETIKKPGQKGSGYQKATVKYFYNGEPRTQSIMSFSNPKVFNTVQGWEKEGVPTEEVDVKIVKNDAGYSEWASINAGEPAGAGNKVSAATSIGSKDSASTTRVTGSNYETREERAARQVLIVKQSSLSAAVATLAPGAKAALDPKDVIAVAQEYTDFVFAQDEEDQG